MISERALFLEGYQALPLCPFGKSDVYVRWVRRIGGNNTDRENPKYSGGKNLSQCLFAHQKSHMDWPGIEAGLRGDSAATDRREFDYKD